MSNAIRYDSLLVRDLAADLNHALAGARLDDVFLERDRLRAVLQTRAARRGDAEPPSLSWNLHPSMGQLTTGFATVADSGRVQLAAAARIVRVYAPPDERVIIMDLDDRDGHDGAARRIIIELITNQWNAIAVSADDRIVAVLRERDVASRQLRAGLHYRAPPASNRIGADGRLTAEQWHGTLSTVPPGERLRALLRFAYMSPLNAPAVLQDADVTGDDDALHRAFLRYQEMTSTERRQPGLMSIDGLQQPYSVALTVDMVAAESLLDAFNRSAVSPQDAGATDTADENALAAIAHRHEYITKRIARMRAEQEGAADEAIALRGDADVLLANLHTIPRGAASVELTGFDGAMRTIALDPAISGPLNATRIYDVARKRDRAALRIPPLIRSAEREADKLEQLAARVRAGTVDPAELAALRARLPAANRREPGRALPYRLYRATSGAEIRVGKGSRANDELTFHHSAPTDIWLHARDVAGAHVILRWTGVNTNPPANDIAEAAILAALYSKARTSGTVPVDWTRRKHVRKPRKSAPGSVLPERVKTIFVHPDPATEERLRADAEL